MQLHWHGKIQVEGLPRFEPAINDILTQLLTLIAHEIVLTSKRRSVQLLE
jgi:hypothetical protein